MADGNSQWRNVELLESLRSQVAVFQEGRGVAKDSYTFMTLMSAIMTLGGQAVHAVFTLMLALAPVSEIALHVARFALESIVDIMNTPDMKDAVVKAAIFIAQLLASLLVVIFVFGSILFPVWMMGVEIISKMIFSLFAPASIFHSSIVLPVIMVGQDVIGHALTYLNCLAS